MPLPIPLSVYECDQCHHCVGFFSPTDVLFRPCPTQCRCGGDYIGRKPGVLDQLRIKTGSIKVFSGRNPWLGPPDRVDWS